MNAPTARLTPYRRERAGRRIRPISLILIVLYSALTGAGIALLPAQLLFLLAVPLFVAVGVILWLLPDGNTAPVKLLSGLLVWFIGSMVLWPSYLAVDLPGLPWINPPRVFTFLLLAIALFSFSTSSQMRREMADALRAMPYLRIAFWLFWVTTAITIVLSNQLAFSLNKWINAQIFWTFMLCIAAWLGTKDGTIKRVAHVLVWATILAAVESIYEFKISEVPWADHIPSFLRVDDTSLMYNVLRSQARSGTDIYRARSTFNTSLAFAEYLAIAYPFLIHATFIARGLWRKALLSFGLIGVLTAMWLTNSRSAMIGFFLSVFLYGGFATYRHWKRNRGSLIGVSIIAMLPVMAGVFFALALTWPRLHNMTFGGAQHQPSSEARVVQWHTGMQQVWSNPVGHGAGTGAGVLGYRNPGGVLTIDTYYLSLMLEYGLLGFASFMVLFGGQAVIGLRLYLGAETSEELLAGPITIGLLNFLVIKSVSSGEFLHPIVFILLGLMFAISWRQMHPSALPASVNRPRLGHGYPAGALPAE